MSREIKLNQRGEEDVEDSGALLVERRVRVKKPSNYAVLLHNDDFTPMDFVVLVLERFFGLKHEKATQVMLDVHQKGKGVCGLYPFELAETKVAVVTQFAKDHEHPLKCTMEKV